MLPLPGEPHPRLPLRDTARRDGPRSALTAFHQAAGPRTLVCGPAGHVLAPRELVADATRVVLSGRTAARVPARERHLAHALPARLDLVALRCPAPVRPERPIRPIRLERPDRPDRLERPDGPDRSDGLERSNGPDRSGRWAGDAVLWLRLGLAQHLMAAVLDHLGERSFGDTPLVRLPATKSALAEVAVTLLETESNLRGAPADGPDDATLLLLHQQVTTVDDTLLRLLGANGLTSSGPGVTAHVSRLLADLYAPCLILREAA
ncbi:hypothetical protein ACWC1C_36720 [Streptomyces sp. NPDC001705]